VHVFGGSVVCFEISVTDKFQMFISSKLITRIVFHSVTNACGSKEDEHFATRLDWHINNNRRKGNHHETPSKFTVRSLNKKTQKKSEDVNLYAMKGQSVIRQRGRSINNLSIDVSEEKCGKQGHHLAILPICFEDVNMHL